MQKVIIGKSHVIDNVLINILSNGNLLFEDYPGLAKTLMTNTFADALGCDFKRVQFTPDFAEATRTAQESGAPVLCDARMVREGITRARLPANNQVICTLQDPQVKTMAEAARNTRSAVALELWRPYLDGSVVAIGNAPTALFHLLNMLEEESCPRPAAIIGCPVGFVGAKESKDALMAAPPVPSCIVEGRLGGSAIAVAAVNALASWTE